MAKTYANITRKAGETATVTVSKGGNTYTYGGSAQSGSLASKAIETNKRRKEERAREIAEFGESGELSPEEYRQFHSTQPLSREQARQTIIPKPTRPQPANMTREQRRALETQQKNQTLPTSSRITYQGMRESQALKQGLPIRGGLSGMIFNPVSVALVEKGNQNKIQKQYTELNNKNIDVTDKNQVNQYNQKVGSYNKQVQTEQLIQNLKSKEVNNLQSQIDKREARLIILRQEANQFKGKSGERLRKEIRSEQENIFSLQQKIRQKNNQSLLPRPVFSESTEQKNLIVKQQGKELKGIGKLGYVASIVGTTASKTAELVASGKVGYEKSYFGLPILSYTSDKTQKDIKQVQQLRKQQQNLITKRQYTPDNTQQAKNQDKKINQLENQINKIDSRLNIAQGIRNVSENPRKAGLISSAGAGITAGVGLLSVGGAGVVAVGSKVLPATGATILKSAVTGTGIGFKVASGVGFAGVKLTELGSIKNKKQREERLGESIGEISAFTAGAGVTSASLKLGQKVFTPKQFNPKNDFLLKGKSTETEKLTQTETLFKGKIAQGKINEPVTIKYKTIKLKSGEFQETGIIKFQGKETPFTRIVTSRSSLTSDTGLKSIMQSAFKIDKTFGTTESKVFKDSINTELKTGGTTKDVYTKILSSDTKKTTILGEPAKNDILSIKDTKIIEGSFSQSKPKSIFKAITSETKRVFSAMLRSKKASLATNRNTDIYGDRFLSKSKSSEIPTIKPKISSSFKTDGTQLKTTNFGTFSSGIKGSKDFSGLISGFKPSTLPKLPSSLILPPTLGSSKASGITYIQEKPPLNLGFKSKIKGDFGSSALISSKGKPKYSGLPKQDIYTKPITTSFNDLVGKEETKPVSTPLYNAINDVPSITKPSTSASVKTAVEPTVFTSSSPYSSTIPSAPVFPPFVFQFPTIGGGGAVFSNFKKPKVKQPKRFTPSFRAAAFNLTGKTTKGSILSGLGERFVIKPKKKKKVKKNGRRRRI